MVSGKPVKQKKQQKQNQRNPSSSSSPLRLIGGQYEINGRWPIFALAVLTYLLSLPLFAPWSWWPFGFIVFTPWIVSFCIARRRFWVYLASYLLGAAFFLTHFKWLYSTTPPGYIAGSLYLAIFFPVAAWLMRYMYRKRNLSMAITFPIVWTGLEFFRSIGPLSFPWFLLGHSQIRLLTMVQIADLAGVFGVTFVVAVVNGWLADLLLRPIMVWKESKGRRAWRIPAGTVVMIVLLVGTIVYGRIRLNQNMGKPGPEVAVLQGDFKLFTDGREGHSWREKRDFYLNLVRRAAQRYPDMIVLPETPWTMYLNKQLRELRHNGLLEKVNEERREELLRLADISEMQNRRWKKMSKKYDTAIVVGSLAEEPQPDGAYPLVHRYNSAFVYKPESRNAGRYNKIHRVLFGEYVPFRYNEWLNPLYWWLNSLSPWGSDGYEYSITAGTEFTTFSVNPDTKSATTQSNSTEKDSGYEFAITICYEDAIPQVFREFVVDDQGNKRVDFMLNISNDGWFGHGPQQPQHLVNCAFRAVENRVSVARSVNTGISGFVRPDGSWHSLITGARGTLDAGGTGYEVARVQVNPRVTVYSVYGDAFGIACLIFLLVGMVDAVVAGFRHRFPRRPKNKEVTSGG
jgi:apolipoprotein N-acyltransferase